MIESESVEHIELAFDHEFEGLFLVSNAAAPSDPRIGSIQENLMIDFFSFNMYKCVLYLLRELIIKNISIYICR